MAEVRRSRGRVLILLALIVAMMAVSLLHDPETIPRSSCLIRNITGLPCPSCGLTRAFHALSTGRIGDALAVNVVSPLVFLAAWVIGILAATDLLVRPGLLGRIWSRVGRGVVWTVLVLMAISWTVNLVRHFQEHTLLQSLADSLPGRLLAYCWALL